MTVDMQSAQERHPAFAMLRRILDQTDQQWLHERAGADRQLLRRFRAQRRRTFYSCIGEIREAARRARMHWRDAADRLQDYSGVDWPLETAKFHARLGWVCLVAEAHFLLGAELSEGWRLRLEDHLDRAADFTRLAIAAN